VAQQTLITRLTRVSGAADAAMPLVIASACESSPAPPLGTHVTASSLRFSPIRLSSGHSLTRLVKTGTQAVTRSPVQGAASASDKGALR
jgi:hypothetical protein